MGNFSSHIHTLYNIRQCWNSLFGLNWHYSYIALHFFQQKTFQIFFWVVYLLWVILKLYRNIPVLNSFFFKICLAFNVKPWTIFIHKISNIILTNKFNSECCLFSFCPWSISHSLLEFKLPVWNCIFFKGF